MAETPTAEQTEVRRRGRQRLIGAIVIVLLAVVFVPMILDPEPRKEPQEPALTIPPKDSAPPLPAPMPPPKVAEAPAKAEAPKVETPKAEAPKAEAPKPDAAKVVAPKSSEFMSAATPPKAPAGAKDAAASKDPAPKTAAAPAPAVAPKLEGFAVQVGAFKEEDKLKQARERLANAKIPHFTERLASSDLTRLRAGPFPTKEAAEKALASVKLAGLDGKVVPLP